MNTIGDWLFTASNRVFRHLDRKLFPHRKSFFKKIKTSNDLWPFQELNECIESGNFYNKPNCFASIEARVERLKKQLENENRLTYYRHELQNINAWDACEGVSSNIIGQILLYQTILLMKPRWTLELGSAFGLGSMAIALGLRDRPETRFVGIEYEAWRAEIANENVRSVLGDRAQVLQGAIEDILPKVAEETGLFDWAFVDAKHTYEATMGYHNLLANVVSKNAIVIYDDINWSAGMDKCWRDIVKDREVTHAVSIADRWGIVSYSGRSI